MIPGMDKSNSPHIKRKVMPIAIITLNELCLDKFTIFLTEKNWGTKIENRANRTIPKRKIFKKVSFPLYIKKSFFINLISTSPMFE
jgi:hypothetical protein